MRVQCRRGVREQCARETRIHHLRASPPGVSQDLTKASVVRLVVQEALHPINFRVDLVAVERYHRQSATGIDIVSPITLAAEILANKLAKVQKLAPNIG